MLICSADLESLFIANSKLASCLIVKLSLKPECAGTAGGKLLCYAFNRLPKDGVHGVVQGRFLGVCSSNC